MRKFILNVRPEPDAALDVATLARRNVPALSAPLMAPSYHAPEIPASGKFSGVIFTSRHAVTGLCAATGGKLDDRIAGLPAFAVGRATGRAARKAGFRNVTIGHGGGAGLVPLITEAAPRLDGPLLWPAAVHRGFDMAAALDGIADVITRPAYEMRETEILPDDAVAAIAGGNVLGVILMSARSARLFRERLLALGQDRAVASMALIAGSDAIVAAAGDNWAETFVSKRPARARLLAIASLLYDRRTRS